MFCRHCGARTARTCAPYAHSCGPLGSRHGGDGGASQERSRHGHGLIVTIELNVMCRSRSVTKLRSLRTRVADDTPWDLGDRYRTVGGVGPLPDNFVPDLWRCIASSRAPHLAFDIPRRILQEYCEPILNKRSIKAVGRLWSSPHLAFDNPRRILHDYGEKTMHQQSINAAGPSKEHI